VLRGVMLGLWAQSTPAAPGTDPLVVARIALRRWFSGLTLSGPEVFSSQIPWLGLLGGLAGLLILAMAVQGPVRALAQLFDIPGHIRLVAAALARFRGAGRLTVLLLLVAVVSWTAWEARTYSATNRFEELALLIKNKGVFPLAVEQGVLAALTPLRELAGLGDTLILMLVVAVLVFKLGAERWEGDETDDPGFVPVWITPTWIAAWLFVLYRLTLNIIAPDGYPISASTYVEPVLIPTLMLICDGLLLGCVLGEVRRVNAEGLVGSRMAEAVRWLPASIIACVAALPARVVAVMAYLILKYVPASAPSVVLGGLLWLLLSWGLIVLQAGSLVALPWVGAAAYGPVRGGTWLVWWRMMRDQGGRLVGLVALNLLACLVSVTAVYAVVLQYPVQAWLLAAADSYSHFVTIPLGLILMATLVEIADRASRPAESPVQSEPVNDDVAVGAL